MKHMKMITCRPQVAQTSTIEIKLNFVVELYDRLLTIEGNKRGGAY